MQVANYGVAHIFQSQVTGDEFVLESTGAVHVIVDLFGAFIEPQATPVETTQFSTFRSCWRAARQPRLSRRSARRVTG